MKIIILSKYENQIIISSLISASLDMTTSSSYLGQQASLSFSHMGFYVRDLERMAAYYKGVLGFFETDRGNLGPVELVFLSRDPAEHHQVVLASGKPEGQVFNAINQISFRVPDVGTLRSVRDQAAATPGTTELTAVSHGNAISIYFRDPEGNRIEVFYDTPWYCEQPLREPIDLNQSDAAVLAQAEAMARGRPKFQPRAQWQSEMARRMGYAQAPRA